MDNNKGKDKDRNKLSPYIRHARDQIINLPWYISERIIFDYEILFLKEGKLLVTVEDESYQGEPGDIFLFRPGQRHSIRGVGNISVRQPHIHFDLFYQEDSPDVKISFKSRDKMIESELKMIRDDDFNLFDIHLPSKIRLHKTENFERLLFDVIEEYQAKLPFYETNVKGLFLRLWTYLLRELYWDSNPEVFSIFEQLKEVKNYLDNYFYREVTLDELASEFNISKYYLVRLFKQTFSYSPIQYHQIIRGQKVKEMIQYTDRSLTQIAELFGYSSINAFSRAFKNLDGVPASYYRKNKKQ